MQVGAHDGVTVAVSVRVVVVVGVELAVAAMSTVWIVVVVWTIVDIRIAVDVDVGVEVMVAAIKDDDMLVDVLVIVKLGRIEWSVYRSQSPRRRMPDYYLRRSRRRCRYIQARAST